MKILCLNIEGEKHQEKVLALLKKEKPAVACLQEITKATFDHYVRDLSMQGFFAPMTVRQGKGELGKQWGVAILTDRPAQLILIKYYDNFSLDYPEMRGRRGERPLAVVLVIAIGETAFRIATTHFTWTPDGGVTEEQRINLASLLEAAEEYSSLLLCGDFNAPRGTEIHTKLSQAFHDPLPLTIETTLDPILHRSGKQLVVDGFFITRDLVMSNIYTIEGISDHCAVVGEIKYPLQGY